MAVLITSNNYSGQTADVTLYTPTGYTIPYNNVSATTINVGSQVLPFTYQAEYEPMEYGVFSLYFSSFDKTCTTSQVTPPDGDGNVYNIIKIGNQVWMAENLRTTKFIDGTPLYYATTTGVSTTGYTLPFYTYVNNDSGNTETYGLLYNYNAVSGSTSGSTTNNLCPVGWRVPTDVDISILINYPNFGLTNGYRNQYPGNEYWNVGGNRTNESGFSLMGAGYFTETGWQSFKQISLTRMTTPSNSVLISSATSPVFTVANFAADIGASVRCIKN